MTALSELQFEEITKLLHQFFLTPLEARLQHAEDILKVVALRIEHWYSSGDFTAHGRLRLREELLAIARSETLLQDKETKNANANWQWLPQLQAKLETFISQQEEFRHEIQKEERFRPLPDDAGLLRTGKFLKNKLRTLKAAVHTADNWLRDALGKEERPSEAWVQEIPLQGLLRHHLQVQVLHRLQELVNIGERQHAATLQAVVDLSAFVDRQAVPARAEIQQEISHRLKRDSQSRQHTRDLLHRQLQAILGRFYIELENDYGKAGTLELPASKLQTSTLQRKQAERRQQIETHLLAWQNTSIALYNQWSLTLLLHTVTDKLHLQLEDAQNNWRHGLSMQVHVSVDKIVASLTSIKHLLQESPLPEAFIQSRLLLREQLAQKEVSQAVTALTRQDLPGQLQAIEAPLKHLLVLLPEEINMAQATSGLDATPVPVEQLTPVQVRELVSLEVLPLAINKLLQLKTNAQQQLQTIENRLGEIEEICLFNLDAAHAYWESHPQDNQKARDISIEGLERALAHTAGVQDHLRQLSAHTWQEIQQLHGLIGESLLQLNQLENIKSLEIRKSRKKNTKYLNHRRPSFTSIQALGTRLQQYVKISRSQEAQPQHQAIQISANALAELSDFIAGQASTVQQLPFVYQRLYTQDPLSDELFLTGRSAELEILHNAYARWQEGKFSATMINGEKGSGASTLINIFLNKLPQKQPIVRLQLLGYPHDQQGLAKLLAQSLGLAVGSSLAAVKAYLLAPPEPLVLIIEDLQHLFRRWVGGFRVIKDFLELVSLTNRSVCWLCSCNLYSWEYLSRATPTSEAWSTVLQLQALDPAQLSELLLRRQRMSGYQLHYEPTQYDLENKHFKALPPDEQQAQLEQRYFQQLYAFAEGNPRVALLYWLGSTRAVTKDAITVKTTPTPPLMHLQQLPESNYFCLHALLLHDQLRPAELARMLGDSEDNLCRQLQQLQDWGLLLCQQHSYRLNPLLYRQFVQILKLKNMIH